MNKFNEEFKKKFNEYIEVNGIAQGTEPVPLEYILRSFQSYAPTFPVTKAMLGRALTKSFLKKQHYVFADQTLSQCYYLNKSV
jgi:hypothetical protein